MENNLLCFKRTSNLTALSLPREYREGFYTKTGVWIKLVIIKGKLKLVYLNEQFESKKEYSYNKKSEIPLIEDDSLFRILPTSNDLQFHLEFYCKAPDYFSNKYNLASAHKDLVASTEYIKPCKTLDLGAGQGRNSLYLASLGFEVFSVDNNALFLQELADISLAEKLNMNVSKHDINEANIKGMYDFIFATDVLMYLNPTRISSIIKNIQNQTNISGYNLITSALHSTNNMQTPYPFTFIENELKEYYDGWEIIEYKEIKEKSIAKVILLAKKGEA